MSAEHSMACQVENLSVAYKDTAVLQRATFDVPAGVVMGIVGPNGAGKSTLLKAMLGLQPPLTGRAVFFGQKLANVRSRVGYMPQSSGVDWDFPASVFDVVQMGTFAQLGWFRRPGAQQKKSTFEALEMVGMSDFAGRQFGQLSGGQRQRVFLARALVSSPDLYILDEPFQGIDAKSQAAIARVFADLRSDGKTIVFVHHDLGSVREYCDQVTLLNRTVVASGPVDTTYTTDAIGETFEMSLDERALFGAA